MAVLNTVEPLYMGMTLDENVMSPLYEDLPCDECELGGHEVHCHLCESRDDDDDVVRDYTFRGHTVYLHVVCWHVWKAVDDLFKLPAFISEYTKVVGQMDASVELVNALQGRVASFGLRLEMICTATNAGEPWLNARVTKTSGGAGIKSADKR